MLHLAVTLALSLDPKSILDSLSPYGEIGLMLIIFAETGLLVGFFLPGDSLMFTAGLLASQGSLNLALVLVGCFAAAVIGDQVGFTIGEVVGPRVGRNPNARIIKPAYIERTHAFFERHGPKTIVLARFVPIVRTFAPVVAGVARMRRSVFLRYNVVGAGLWVVVATMLGYLLADLIGDSIDTYILPIIGVIVLVSLDPAASRVAQASQLGTHPTTSGSANRRRPPSRSCRRRQCLGDVVGHDERPLLRIGVRPSVDAQRLEEPVGEQMFRDSVAASIRPLGVSTSTRSSPTWT